MVHQKLRPEMQAKLITTGSHPRIGPTKSALGWVGEMMGVCVNLSTTLFSTKQSKQSNSI